MFVAIYSIFVFMFLGYFANRVRLLGDRQGNILLGFLLNFALPSAIFTGVYHSSVSLELLGLFALALVCNLVAGALAFVFVSKILRFDFGTSLAMAFLVSLHNTLFLGVPIVQGALGEQAAHKAIVLDQFCTGLPLAVLTPLLLSLSSKTKFRIQSVLVRLFASPLFLSMLCAFVLKAMPFSIPEVLFAPILSLAACATPVALFAIGVQLRFDFLRLLWRKVLVVLGFGMFVAPLLYLAILRLFQVPLQEDHQMVLLEVAMPPLISAVAVIARAGLDSKLAISCIVAGVPIAAFSTPLWLYISHL